VTYNSRIIQEHEFAGPEHASASPHPPTCQIQILMREGLYEVNKVLSGTDYRDVHVVSSCTLPWEPPAVQCLMILLPQRGAMRTGWRNLPSTNSCLVDRSRSAAGHSCLPWDGKFDSRCWPGELLARDRCTVHGAARRPMLGPPQILVWVISAPLTDGVLGSGALEKNGAAQAPVQRRA
jgi:hypothetical protein